MFLLAFVAIGVAIGCLRGGSLRDLALLRIRHAWLIILGLLLQVVAFTNVLPATPAMQGLAPVLHVSSYGALLSALALNADQRPLRVVMAGALANYVAIVINGGYMPASFQALQMAGMDSVLSRLAVNGHLQNSVLIGAHTHLTFLGDIFALPAELPLANIFSIGDIVIGHGVLMLVVQAMTTQARLGRAATANTLVVEGRPRQPIL
ncbi:MAG: DUF5317 domain-containing protein [Chloroflexota bacterium]